MLEFARTQMGKKFLDGTIPKLVRAIEALTTFKRYEYKWASDLAEVNRLGADGWRLIEIERADPFLFLMEKTVSVPTWAR